MIERFCECPLCEKKTSIETIEERGNTYCVVCGDKVEGGYCSCFNN